MDKPIAPVRRQIVVPVEPDVAFEVWTAEIGKWWPLGRGHSVYGEGGTVRFVDGKLVEESVEGTAVWGSVVEWAPPRLLRLTWHPGRDASRHGDVCVRFAAVGETAQTLVTLEHTGWERFDDPLRYRDEYASGWVTVIGRYEDRVRECAIGAGAGDRVMSTSASERAAFTSDGGEAWLVLAHSPGVRAPSEGNVFAHPDFAAHLSFVDDLAARGWLVAAGPVGTRPGHGMTIVKVPADDAAALLRQAYEQDLSVARGLLQVEVDAWRVRAAHQGLRATPAQ